MRVLLVVAGALLCLFFSFSAQAAGPAIGPLCIDGVTAKVHPDRASPRDDGVWTPVDYTLDKSQAGKARVVILDRSITPSDQFETCAITEKRMVAAGAHTILSGRVRSLKFSAQIFNGPGGNRFQIDPGALDLTLWQVESGSRPVAGGSIDFRGAGLRIGTTQTVLATPVALRGELEIKAFNRTITEAHITLGGLDFIANLRPAHPSYVSVRLDLGTGQARIWSGSLMGLPKTAASGDMHFPFMGVAGATMKARRVDVVVSSGKADVVFAMLDGTAAALSITNSPLIWRLTSPTINVGKAGGAADQSADSFALKNPELTALAMPAATASLESASGDALFKGIVSASFSTLGQRRRMGTSSWASASSPILDFLMPGGISRVKWSEAGSGGILTVSGSVDLPQLSLGGMELTQPLSISLQPTRLTGDLVIPIKVDVPAAKGSVSFLNGDQTIGIEGRLDRLSIDGKLVIAVAAFTDSHFEAKPGKVNFAVGAAVSVSPVIAGVKPNFLDAEISASNLTDLRVARAGSEGIALLATDVLVLAQPVFKVGDKGTASQATVDLKANGSAKLQYDLADRKVGVAQAKLTADDVAFSLLGAGDKVVDFGGTLVTNPAGTLKRLVVEVDRLSSVQVESAWLDTLSVSSGKIAKVSTAGSSSELSYAGTPTRPLTVSAAHATRVKIDDKIALGLFLIEGLDFGVADADVDFGSGVTLAHATLDLRAAALREAELGDKIVRQLTAVKVGADGKIGVHTSGFSINDRVEAQVNLALDGPEKALNGGGTIKIGPFTGDARSTLPIGFDCENSHELDVDMEADIGFAGANMDARMTNGKLSGDARFGPIVAAVHSTGGTSCNAPSIHHVVAPKGAWWTDGVCNKGLKFYHCRWESPEISYTYHITLNVRSLDAPVALSEPHLYLRESGDVKICNVGVVVIGTPIIAVGGYTPGIESNYPGLDNIVNGIIQLTLEPFQTILASSIGNTAGWLVSTIATAGGNTFCFEKKK